MSAAAPVDLSCLKRGTCRSLRLAPSSRNRPHRAGNTLTASLRRSSPRPRRRGRVRPPPERSRPTVAGAENRTTARPPATSSAPRALPTLLSIGGGSASASTGRPMRKPSRLSKSALQIWNTTSPGLALLSASPTIADIAPDDDYTVRHRKRRVTAMPWSQEEVSELKT